MDSVQKILIEKKNLLHKRKIQSEYFHLINLFKKIDHNLIFIWKHHVFFFWSSLKKQRQFYRFNLQPPRNGITLDYCQTQKVLFYIHLMISDDFTGMAKSTFLLMSDSIADTFSYTVHLQNHQWSFSIFELSCLALSCFFPFLDCHHALEHIDQQTKEGTTIKPTNK